MSRVNDIRRSSATLFRIHSEMIRFRLAELIADKAFKERRSISMTEVAEGSGVHRATLSKMANQPGTNVGTEIVDKLCRYFQCQPGDLLTYLDIEDG
jgi:putative transcriptional regulator